MATKSPNATYYDEGYFLHASKAYTDRDGKLKTFGYLGSNLPFFKLFTQYLLNNGVNFQSCLDVCCGIGDMTIACLQAGRHGEGVDWSEKAIKIIKDTQPAYAGYFHTANVKKLPFPDASFDLVTLIDAMEHIYKPDINAVIRECKRVARKWIITKTCTAETRKDVYFHKLGDKVSKQWEWLLVSGHVSSALPDWWDKLWVDRHWSIDYEWGERAKLALHLPHDWRSLRFMVKT